ncbi:hypothetical protein [Acidisphaera rubrifaciens]|uniref:Uncharacterized protein n=1 Tax=Acidisphaera rubrifaciens HS-AP3 TaxID=1231350 RepID=A0A0D6P8B8_9PROT|nr:hypothetical protein [Acidisphaera rubrifaciens]GAN78015.1 hypothetical protein Asru_0572_05 [Acidisphaera rubrifaciens HS-AP3]
MKLAREAALFYGNPSDISVVTIPFARGRGARLTVAGTDRDARARCSVRQAQTYPDSSGLDKIAAGTMAISMPRQATLGLLLGATLPLVRHGCPALRPLWADEAMQRALDTVRLIATLARRAPVCGADHILTKAEFQIAGELAAAYRALDYRDDAEPRSCSEGLRTVVRDLVELFAPIAGSVRLYTTIERLSLPAFRCRALTLAASKLVVSALCTDLIDSKNLTMRVSLCRPRRGVARLAIADNVSDPARAADEIVSDLAALLEGDLTLHANPGGGVATELRFPI